MLPTNQIFRQTLLPLLDHRQPGKVEEDDENSGNPERHLVTLSELPLPWRRERESQVNISLVVYIRDFYYRLPSEEAGCKVTQVILVKTNEKNFLSHLFISHFCEQNF